MRFRIIPTQDLKKGIFLVTIAWLLFSTMWMLSKVVIPHSSVPMVLLFRNVVGFGLVIPWVLVNLPTSLKLKSPKWVIVRSATGLTSLFFILLAIRQIPLVDVTLLTNSAPFYVPFFIYFWFKKPVDHKLWPAVLAGFIGIALILHPDAGVFQWGSIFGLLSGLTMSISIIAMRMASKAERFPTYLFYFFSFGLLVTLPFAIFDWKIDGFWPFLGLLGVGVTSALGQFFLFLGMKQAKASQLAPFTYTSVIFAGIYEFLIWDKVPDVLDLIGTVFIVAAGVWVVRLNTPNKKLK